MTGSPIGDARGLASLLCGASLAAFPQTALAAPGTVEAVVVNAQRPAEQVLPDRRVYSISQDLQAASGSAADVMGKIPSLEVDADGALSLRGDSRVVILVDGKASAQFSGPTAGSALLQYPASEIDRIEVLTNPPAQYKADGVGVVNIVTKRSHRPGPSGSVRASLGDRRRFNAAANGAWNGDHLSLSGTVSLKQDDKQRVVSSRLAVPDPVSTTTFDTAETLREQLRRLSPLVKAGLEYRPSDRQTWTMDLSHGEQTGDRFFNQHDASGPAGAPVTGVSDRHSDGHDWQTHGSQRLAFEQQLRVPDETLNLALERSVVRERERYAYTNRFTLPLGPDTHDHLNLSLDLTTTEFTLDYVAPLAKDQTLKLGLDLQDDVNTYDNFGDKVDPATGVAAVNPFITNHFRYRQQLSVAYASYLAPLNLAVLGAWTLQAGLRAEQADVSFHLRESPDITRHGYFRLYPSLHLERALNDDDHINLSASRRVSRPEPEHLNPFTDNQDVLNLRAGNPDLRPQDTNAFEGAFTHAGKGISYTLTAYARFNRNAETDITRALSDTVKLTTFTNLPRSEAGGVEFSASGKFNPQLSYNVSGNGFFSQIHAAALSPGADRRSTGLNLKASFDWRPTATDTFQLSASRSDRRITPEGSIGAINLVNLGYKRQVTPELSMVATLSDALDGQCFRRYVDTDALTSRYERRQVGRIAYVGFVYVIGAPKKAKPAAFDYDQ